MSDEVDTRPSVLVSIPLNAAAEPVIREIDRMVKTHKTPWRWSNPSTEYKTQQVTALIECAADAVKDIGDVVGRALFSIELLPPYNFVTHVPGSMNCAPHSGIRAMHYRPEMSTPDEGNEEDGIEPTIKDPDDLSLGFHEEEDDA